MAELKPGANELLLTLFVPGRKILETLVPGVSCPGEDGILGILPGHAALVCALGCGALQFKTDEGLKVFVICHGTAEVRDNCVTILADSAEEAEKVDLARAEKALSRARERLAKVVSGSDVDLARAHAAEARALARLEAAMMISLSKK